MERKHNYKTNLKWTGNLGTGTIDYKTYIRDHEINIDGKPKIFCSSDPAFRGDPSRHNPEEMLVASLSSCHMLWYLHLCAVNGVNVIEYQDHAEGTMIENRDGSGQFQQVVLKPKIRVEKHEMIPKAKDLHSKAHKMCFISNSCNFPVLHEPEIFV